MRKPVILWGALINRLRAQAARQWALVLGRLPHSDDVFTSRLVPMVALPETALGLAVTAMEFSPASPETANDQLPLLLLQALGKTEEHRAAVLLALARVHSRASLGGSDRAHQRALAAAEMHEKSKDVSVKNAALKLQCVLLCKRPDAARLERFLGKRVTRPLVYGADAAKTARALDLCCTAVALCPAVALPVAVDAVKKCKALRADACASGDAVETRLALLAETMAKADAATLALFVDPADATDAIAAEPSKRALAGLCALRRLLDAGLARFASFAGSLLPGVLASADADPPVPRDALAVAPLAHADDARLRLGEDDDAAVPRYTSTDDDDVRARARLVIAVEAMRALALLGCQPSDAKHALPMAAALYPSPRFLDLRHHACMRAAALAGMRRIVATSVSDGHRLVVVDQLREVCAATAAHVDELASLLQSIVDAGGLARKQQDALESLVLALAGAGLPSCDALAGAVQGLFPSSQLCAMLRAERNVVTLALSKPLAGLGKQACAILDAWATRNPALAVSPRCVAVRCALCRGPAPSSMELLWDAALKFLPGERDKAAVLCDVAAAAGHDGETAADVLKRAAAWCKKTLAPAEAAATAAALAAGAPASASKSKTAGFFMRRDPGVVLPTPLAPAQGAAMDPERVWVACRVTRRVAEGGALRDGMDKHATGSDVLKLLRASIVAASGACAEGEAVVETCAAVQLLSAAVAAWAGGGDVLGQHERGDIVWGRAERRGAWLWLRKVYNKQPRLRGVATDTAVALLGVGPVSLGRVADALDAPLWAWAKSAPVLCGALLTAHWASYLGAYLQAVFDPAEPERRVVYGAVYAATKTWVPSGPLPDDKCCAGVVAASLLALADGYGHLDLLCCGLLRPAQDFSHSMVELLAYAGNGADVQRLAALARQLRKDLCRPVFDLLAAIGRFDVGVALARDFSHFEPLLRAGVPASVWAAIEDRESCLGFLVERLDAGAADAVDMPLATVVALAEPAAVARTLVEALDPNKHLPGGAAARCLAPRVMAVCEACTPAQFATLACFVYSCHVSELETGMAAWAAVKCGHVAADAGIDGVVEACGLERTRLWCATALVWACTAVDLAVRASCVDAYATLRPRAGTVDWPNGVRGEAAALVQLPRRMGVKGLQALARTVTAGEADALQVGSNAIAGALSEVWASARLVDEALELAAVDVIRRCPARPSVAKQLFWAGFARAVRASMAAGELAPRAAEVCALVAEQLGEDEAAALRCLAGEVGAQCGETALLVMLELALEAGRPRAVVNVLAVGGPRVAVRAVLLLVAPPLGMAGVVEAASALITRSPPLPSSSSLSGSSSSATAPTPFRALADEDDALERAQRAWAGVALEQLEAPGFVTKRRTRPAARTDVSESMLRPRSSILDVVAAPSSKDAAVGERLTAHAVDVGVDPAWVRYWMDPSAVRARALGMTGVSDEELRAMAERTIEEDLWPSFMRSRWWLYEEE